MRRASMRLPVFVRSLRQRSRIVIHGEFNVTSTYYPRSHRCLSREMLRDAAMPTLRCAGLHHDHDRSQEDLATLAHHHPVLLWGMPVLRGVQQERRRRRQQRRKQQHERNLSCSWCATTCLPAAPRFFIFFQKLCVITN